MIFEAQTADASLAGERDVLQSCIEQAVFAEAMGFDRVWAVEHHSLKWYAHMSAPEIFLTWVAARHCKRPRCAASTRRAPRMRSKKRCA